MIVGCFQTRAELRRVRKLNFTHQPHSGSYKHTNSLAQLDRPDKSKTIASVTVTLPEN